MKQTPTVELARTLEKTEAAAWQYMVAAASEDYKITFHLKFDI
ncbi:MAG: hypothetical protein ABI675_00420 [Chitinophagaceae bacterium]